jgi:hypothetical protein
MWLLCHCSLNPGHRESSKKPILAKKGSKRRVAGIVTGDRASIPLQNLS